MSLSIEHTILESLIGNNEYARQTLPHIKEEYFESRIDRLLFKEIERFFNEHNKAPTKKILSLFVDDCGEVKQDEFTLAHDVINSFSDIDPNTEWLLQRTEKWAKEKAVFNAIMTSIGIMDGRNEILKPEAIPSLLQDALGVCFNKSVGHDFFDSADKRYDFYNLKEDRVPFDLEMFNRITKGGIPSKTLNFVVAGVNVGKSLALCHFAAATIKQGKNALYITMEMAEERIAERIDCNLLNLNINDLHKISKTDFIDRVREVESKTHGRLIVKEYPTCGASVAHFRALLLELQQKKNFVPDVIYVDYLNICMSQRMKGNAQANSYTIVKAIAEELRGLAVEFDTPIFTATQFTRGASTDTDADMTGIAESFGTAMTADFIFALVRTDELDAMGQIMVKQLKSRYNDVNYYKKFVIGVDIAKFKLYDVENLPNTLSDAGTHDGNQNFDKSKFGQQNKKEWNWASDVDFN